MAQWEYMHERIERPLGSEGRDVTPEVMSEMNRLGRTAGKYAAYSQPSRRGLLLKRELPVIGMGGSGGSGGSGTLHRTHTPMNNVQRPEPSDESPRKHQAAQLFEDDDHREAVHLPSWYHRKAVPCLLTDRFRHC